MRRVSHWLTAAALLTTAACGSDEDPGLQPRTGEWEGAKVAFEVTETGLSDWSIWGIFCEGTDLSGSKCFGHPWSSYEDTVATVFGGTFTVELDQLTLEGTLIDELHVEGTWTVEAPGCCTATGEWSAEHVADPPPPPDDTGTGTGDDTTPPILDVPQILDSASAVCARWNGDTADLTEPNSTAETSVCGAGAVDPEGHARVVKIIDLYRALAGLDPVTTDPDVDYLAQSCSLMMQANHTISHTPGPDWACYSSEGAQGAGESNLATAPAVAAVSLYMNDFGNEDTLGHRRWILQRGNGPFGIGSAADYSCLHVMASATSQSSAAWTAWPPPGWFPIQAVGAWQSIDQVGWSVHSYTTSLSGAAASVYDGSGAELEVSVHDLPGGYGWHQALRIVPQGWQMTVGETYEVVVETSPPIIYAFEVVDCDAM